MVETLIDRRRIETALADPRLAPLAAGPMVLAAGAPARVIHATPAALALFRVTSLHDLNARLFTGEEPGAHRLARIAVTLAPGAPRLERLRFFIGGASEALTFQCVRLPGSDGLFAAAAMGVRPALLAPAAAAPATHEEPCPSASPLSAAPAARAPTGLPGMRFLWRTDSDLRFTLVDPALCEAIGCTQADLIGTNFLELAGEPGFDPEGRLCAALMRPETWSGVEVWWPVDEGQPAPVSLGALPTFDSSRAFTGFSGFGVIRRERTQTPAPTEAASIDIPQFVAEQEQEASAATDAVAEHEALTERDVVNVEREMLIEARADAKGGAYAPAAAFMAPNVVALSAWKSSAALAHAPAGDHPPRGDATGDDAGGDDGELVRLTPAERSAFRDIARALGARIEEAEKRRAQRGAGDHTLDAQPAQPDETAPARHADWDNLRRVLDRIDVGLLICRGGEAVYLNRNLLDALGHDSVEAFLDAGGLARMFRGRAPECEALAGVVAVTTANGETLAVEGKLQTIEWEGGPAMLTTFRRPAEAEANARVEALTLDLRARDAERRELRAIVDAASDGVAVLDESGRIVRLNHSAESLLGFTQNEAAGDALTLLLAPESHREALDYFTSVGSSGEASEGRELMGRARSGEHVPLFVKIVPLGPEEAPRYCAVLRDISQWKKVEGELLDASRQAEQASALKSDFLAKISHEIRTPLNAIIGFAEVILEERFGPVGNDRYKDYLKDIHASGVHVMSLVNDLLDLSKIEAGKLELNLDRVDANRVVTECVSMLQAQASRERVIIRMSLAPRFPRLQADERALRQIIINLLSNAVKFNQPGGQVIVSTALADSGGAVIRVRDTGVGMSEADIETALEPFRQIQTSRQTTGTGLGLPLTKALVEAHRATFTITSRKGEGTLVEVLFPAALVSPD